jgi:hypothetical protein
MLYNNIVYFFNKKWHYGELTVKRRCILFVYSLRAYYGASHTHNTVLLLEHPILKKYKIS